MGNQASRESRFRRAASDGRLRDVRALLRKGADKEATNAHGQTALLCAAANGHVDVAQYLIQQGANKEAKATNGWTALICAAANGHVDVAQYLIQQGANKEAAANCGCSVLMCGASFGHLSVVRYLIQQGVNKEARNNNGETARMLAAAKGHAKVVQYLTQQEATDSADLNTTALTHAPARGLVDVAHVIDESRTDILSNHASKDSDRAKELIPAAKHGRLDDMRRLIRDGTDKETKDTDGRTALLHAAREGHVEVVKYLIQCGANKEVTDNEGLTVLIHAAGKDHLDVVQYLLEQGMDVEATTPNVATALMYAARWASLNVVQYLVEHGADINVRTNDGMTALMLAVGGGHLDSVELLLEHGAFVEAQTNAGVTALMQASAAQQSDHVSLLLQNKASPERVDDEGNTALIHLLMGKTGKQDVVRVVAKQLLEHGAPPLLSNDRGTSAKTLARDLGFRGVVDLLKEYAAKPQRQQKEADPLWFIPARAVRKYDRALGAGAFGQVYCAKYAEMDVVVKEITFVEMRRFLKEVEMCHKLRHENIVRFYGANDHARPCFIVMEYASKGELVPFLQREKKARGFPVVWRKLREVAIGLAYLHAQSVVHGDLWGANIVVAKDGTAMLADFGLSFTEGGSCSVVASRDTLGAMAWRAPEFARMTETMKPTCKSDVYSLGMCIIEAATARRHPWFQYTNDSIRANLVKGNILVEKPDELTDVQWSLVRRMIALSPDDRPDAEEIVTELQHFADNEQMVEDLATLDDDP